MRWSKNDNSPGKTIATSFSRLMASKYPGDCSKRPRLSSANWLSAAQASAAAAERSGFERSAASSASGVSPSGVCLRLAGAFAKFQTAPLHRRHTNDVRCNDGLDHACQVLSSAPGGNADEKRDSQTTARP